MDLSFNFDNARYAFGQFDRVTIDGMAFRVHQETEVGFLMVKDDQTSVARQFSHEEIARFVQRKRVRVERDFYSLTGAKKRQMRPHAHASALVGRANRRFTKKEAFCEAALSLHRDKLMKLTDDSIEACKHLLLGRAVEWAADYFPDGEQKVKASENLGKPPSARTLRRWLKNRSEFGLHGHLDNMDRRGNRGSRFSAEENVLLMKEVQKYLSPEKPTIKQIHEFVQLAFMKENERRQEEGLVAFSIPSRETVRRSVRDLDPYRVELARNGEAAARKKFRPVRHGISVTRPLERVEIDEWTVDVMTLLKSTEIYGALSDEDKRALGLYVTGDEGTAPKTEKKGKKKDRWTLTAAICCATRCIVGAVLSRSANSEAAVQLLQMIVVNKGSWSDAVGALTPWDMHGTPELIVFDGGAAFKSLRFRKAAEDLGVMWEMAMNGVPENRGTIERVFKTFASDFAPRLSGHTFSSIIEKGDADPEKRAALTLDDFTFALLRWVVDIYHNTPHSGLGGETPVRAWRRLSKRYGVTPPPDSEMMRLCFGYERKCRLDKTGITVLGVRYSSEAIATYLRREETKTVLVRWHPQNIGAISVQMNKDWYEVSAVDPTLDGVAAQTWLTAVARAKSATPKASRLENKAVREAIYAIEARNEVAMSKAGINLEDWSDKRFEWAEKNLLAGIKFENSPEPTQAKDALGQEIPSEMDLQGKPVVRTKADSTLVVGNNQNISFEED